MTALLERTSPTVESTVESRRWRGIALAAVCVLTVVLHLWGIGETWGNPYYSAAVKSMSQSWENFFFGSFDPVGVITVDKPPMSLWVQTISVWLLGYQPVSLLLPQAIFGVAAVLLLHRTVRRWAGPDTALLAALVLALTPITVVIDRDNNPDTLLMLLVIAAAYATTRAMAADRSGRATGWLALAACCLGCGFLTKMLQAWMVLPALVLAYLVGRRASWVRRCGELAVAAGVLLVSSFWWVVVTAAWPAPKPFIGGSTDGSAWDLVFGYNGFGRVLGGDGNHASGPGRGGGFSGEAGPLRLFNEHLAGQISWLLPVCALFLGLAVLRALRRARAGELDRTRLAGGLLWGGWLCVIGVVFSFAQGTMHPYYTTMLAPAVAAVGAAGAVSAWHRYREHRRDWWVLPLGVAITVAWAFALVRREPDWHGWVSWVVLVLGVLAILALLFGRTTQRWSRFGATAGLVAALLVPALWSVQAVFGGAESPMGGVNPTAGPEQSVGPGGSSKDGGRGFQSRHGGMDAETLSADQRAMLERVKAEAGNRDIPLAVEGGAMSASPLLIHSEVRVVGLGGFTGHDDAPTVAQLAQWRASGRLGFVLVGGGPGGGPDGSGGAHPGRQDHGPAPRGQDTGPPGGPESVSSQQRSDWITHTCTEVGNATGDTPGVSSGELYDCAR